MLAFTVAPPSFCSSCFYASVFPDKRPFIVFQTVLTLIPLTAMATHSPVTSASTSLTVSHLYIKGQCFTTSCLSSFINNGWDEACPCISAELGAVFSCPFRHAGILTCVAFHVHMPKRPLGILSGSAQWIVFPSFLYAIWKPANSKQVWKTKMCEYKNQTYALKYNKHKDLIHGFERLCSSCHCSTELVEPVLVFIFTLVLVLLLHLIFLSADHLELLRKWVKMRRRTRALCVVLLEENNQQQRVLMKQSSCYYHSFI